MLRAILLLLAGPSLAVAGPPNVLWISCDDLAPYAMGCYGSSLAKTPALDAFAQTAMRFDRAYCNSPVCTASRQSYLTGRYPRSLGVTQLRTALPAGTPTLATWFGQAGYETAAIGKMHFNSGLKHGFTTRLDLPEYRKWLADQPPRDVGDGAVQPPWKPFRDPARVWLNAAALPEGQWDQQMAGTFFAHSAGDYLKTSRAKPFFLMVSFYEPHSPFRFPVEDRDTFDPKAFVVPPVHPDDRSQIPAIFRDLESADKRGIAAAYFTSVAFADRNVGRVLDALKQSGHAEDTIVVVTGDHGYLIGQHGRFEKHCGYEEAIRSPLLIRVPGVGKPGQTKALVEFIDIAPTLLESCGLAVPASVQGQTLLPLLRGAAHEHRDAVFVEYSENEEALIRTDRWKLIYSTGLRKRQDGYETGQPLPGRTVRLFDLIADPGETTDVASAHPKHVAELTARLATHLTKTARRPEAVPAGDVHERLRILLRPDDVGR